LQQRIKYILALVFIAALPLLRAQDSGLTKQELDLMRANDLFDQANYVQALDEYLKVEKKFPHNLEIKRRIGTCYLNIHDDKAKALPYLLQMFNKGVFDDELLLELGQAYQYAGQFDKAIVSYSMYREKIPAKRHALIDHYIETCENAKELVKKPVHVKFENLGKDVNTKFADYYPFVSKDESTVYFTSRRDDCLGNARSAFGYFSSDVYFSTVKKGEWQKAKNLGAPINTVDDEEIVGLTPDGQNMIIYVDRKDIASDLMHAEVQRNKKFGRPLPFNEPVNTEGLELEGSYSADANTMFFAAVRKNGLGEADIYCSKKLPNGEWGIPQNLGPNVNTQYKEGFPVVSEDGQVLYFASQGHTSMGGFDIFKSHWDEAKKEWGKAVNIGYPVNTPDDDMMFSLAGKGRDGYLSAWRKEGFGDLDIYRVTFLDVEQSLTAVVGNVRSADSTRTGIEATIAIYDSKNEEIESKEVNPKTGRYIFIVEPGKYRIEISSRGHQPFKEEITVYDKSDYSVELEKNFRLLTEKGGNIQK
jgi:tetratricopeptide (TPR) repeat protein